MRGWSLQCVGFPRFALSLRGFRAGRPGCGGLGAVLKPLGRVLTFRTRSGRGLCPLPRRSASLGELAAQSQQRDILRLRLQHHVELGPAPASAQELLEGDRVDQLGVRSKLRKDERALHAPAAAAHALPGRRLRRRIVDLRGHAGRPGRERQLERLAVPIPAGS